MATPSRRSVPRSFPDSVGRPARSSRSSDSWKAPPMTWPQAASVSTASAVPPASSAPSRAEVAMSEDVFSATTSRQCSTGSCPCAGPTVSRICPSQRTAMVRARIRVASVPRSAVISEARAKRKSPVRMATVLPHRAFAEASPRRTTASSMTSSW